MKKILAVAILSAPFFVSCETEEQVVPITDGVTESITLEAKSSGTSQVNDFSGVDLPGADGAIDRRLFVGDRTIVIPTQPSVIRHSIIYPVGRLKIVSLATRPFSIRHGLLRDYRVRVLNNDEIEIIRVDRTNINPTSGARLSTSFTAQMEGTEGNFFEVLIRLDRARPNF